MTKEREQARERKKEGTRECEREIERERHTAKEKGRSRANDIAVQSRVCDYALWIQASYIRPQPCVYSIPWSSLPQRRCHRPRRDGDIMDGCRDGIHPRGTPTGNSKSHTYDRHTAHTVDIWYDR